MTDDYFKEVVYAQSVYQWELYISKLDGFYADLVEGHDNEYLQALTDFFKNNDGGDSDAYKTIVFLQKTSNRLAQLFRIKAPLVKITEEENLDLEPEHKEALNHPFYEPKNNFICLPKYSLRHSSYEILRVLGHEFGHAVIGTLIDRQVRHVNNFRKSFRPDVNGNAFLNHDTAGHDLSSLIFYGFHEHEINEWHLSSRSPKYGSDFGVGFKGKHEIIEALDSPDLKIFRERRKEYFSILDENLSERLGKKTAATLYAAKFATSYNGGHEKIQERITRVADNLENIILTTFEKLARECPKELTVGMTTLRFLISRRKGYDKLALCIGEIESNWENGLDSYFAEERTVAHSPMSRGEYLDAVNCLQWCLDEIYTHIYYLGNYAVRRRRSDSDAA